MGRQYAHNLHRLALHVQHLPQCSLRAAEVVAGKLLAHQGGMMRIGIRKQTARNRLQAKDAGEVRIHKSHYRVDRVIAQLHADVAAAIKAHGFDTSGLISNIHRIRSCYPRRGVPAVRPVRVKNGEFVGIPIGKRSKQNGFNHGKDGGVCPDAQSQGQRRSCRECLVFKQLAPSEAQVTEEVSGGVLPAIRIHLLFGDGYAAGFLPSGPPGVLGRKAAGSPRGLCFLKVLLYFLRYITIVFRPVRQATQPIG